MWIVYSSNTEKKLCCFYFVTKFKKPNIITYRNLNQATFLEKRNMKKKRTQNKPSIDERDIHSYTEKERETSKAYIARMRIDDGCMWTHAHVYSWCWNAELAVDQKRAACHWIEHCTHAAFQVASICVCERVELCSCTYTSSNEFDWWADAAISSGCTRKNSSLGVKHMLFTSNDICNESSYAVQHL